MPGPRCLSRPIDAIQESIAREALNDRNPGRAMVVTGELQSAMRANLLRSPDHSTRMLKYDLVWLCLRNATQRLAISFCWHVLETRPRFDLNLVTRRVPQWFLRNRNEEPEGIRSFTPKTRKVRDGSFQRQQSFIEKELEMNTMITRVRNFLTSEDGPTAVEYAVLVGLIVAGLAVSVPLLVTAISSAFTSTATTMGS